MSLLRCSDPYVYGTDEYSDGNELAKLLLISTSAVDVEFTALFKLQACPI